MPLSKLEAAVRANLEQRNELDVVTLRDNESLTSQVNKYRNNFNEKEQALLQEVIELFEKEKNEILKNLRKEEEALRLKNARYMQRLSRHKNMMMRLKFSSSKGLDFFSACSNPENTNPTTNSP